MPNQPSYQRWLGTLNIEHWDIEAYPNEDDVPQLSIARIGSVKCSNETIKHGAEGTGSVASHYELEEVWTRF